MADQACDCCNALDEPAEGRHGWSRRLLLRWAGWGSIGTLLSMWMVALTRSFASPRSTRPFLAGRVEDLAVGGVQLFTMVARFFLVRVPEGFLARTVRCPHRQCQLAWKPAEPSHSGPPGNGDFAFASKGRFHCPCHGSIFNRYGQIIEGPGPRPMGLSAVR